jgi:cytochrome d ubiquinol oxidase subunit I
MRTADGYSTNVSSGNAAFTLIGFAGMYTLLSVLFLFSMTRILGKGPDAVAVGGAVERAELSPLEPIGEGA